MNVPPNKDRSYNAAAVQEQVAALWDRADAFHADPAAPGEPYSIVIPPPNVTAALHMGHALNNTLQDILTRYHRMRGDNTLWMPGTDHAGISTQHIVEKRVMMQEGKRRTDFTREQFVEKIQAWKDEYEARITHQLKQMGCSCDWKRQRFTMDPVCVAAVREAFFQLFKAGLIYRGKRLVNWDPVTQTALADDEVEMREIDGHFWYMRYPIVDDAGNDTGDYATVATTRPETMLGDTAVAVNPHDPVNAKWIGRKCRLPIVNRVIPIVGDDYVVMPDANSDDAKAKYASGFLKVTPAHDPNDWEIGRRHDLPVINVMAPDASISPAHGWPIEELTTNNRFLISLFGLDRYAARKAIVDWFKQQGLLADVKPYTHSVGHSYRSHVPIEPYLSDQWYVKVTDERLAGAALRAMAEDQRSESPGCVWKTDSAPQRAATVRERLTSEGCGTTEQSTCDNSPSPDDQSASQGQPLPDGRGSLRQAHGDPQQAATVRERASSEGYLITFTCYGTWLHGDERGWVDRLHSLPGTPIMIGDEENEKAELEKLKQPPMSLDAEQRRVVRDTIVEVCEHRGWWLVAAHVRPTHVHVVVSADAAPERVMIDFKAYSTRRLRERSLVDRDRNVWTRHGSTRYLREESSVLTAARYVVEEQGGSIDPPPFDGRSACGSQPLPDGRGSLGQGDTDQRAATVRERLTSEGALRFYPARYAKTFQSWHENIRDWCISRQLWWGHRIPVWTKTIDLSDSQIDFDSFPFESVVPEFETSKDWLTLQVFGNRETRHMTIYMCVRAGHTKYEHEIERNGWQQDPDVLDTWFSSALWPISTMGWPAPEQFPDEFPEGDTVLKKWNPTDTLCTAREIITLWVSRMVMFNLFFRNCLPFRDVFIHAMIQDGEGQKMSKSLGNGVDPLDIIHSHGADAMRFTLAAMTTQTQDVRMPVDLVCPHTGATISPKMVTTPAGYRVMAPIQDCPTDPKKKMVTTYGMTTGEATPTDDMPLARNTSSKFDEGRNFTNKLWNVVTGFALPALERQPGSASASTAPGAGLADRWILSRLARTIQAADAALKAYEFKPYADAMYDFIWRDFCDWYVEAIKPVVRQDSAAGAAARATAAACIDAMLRALHPVMPFVTEKLFGMLNEACPTRGVAGVELPPGELCVTAAWPSVDPALINDSVEQQFDLINQVVKAIRIVRNQYKVPPRQPVKVRIKAADEAADTLTANRAMLETLCTCTCDDGSIGPDVQRPADAATAVVGEIELFIESIVDSAAEIERLTRRRDELVKSKAALEGRLNNKGYVDRAPAHLVQQSRDQLAELLRELEAVESGLSRLEASRQ